MRHTKLSPTHAAGALPVLRPVFSAIRHSGRQIIMAGAISGLLTGCGNSAKILSDPLSIFSAGHEKSQGYVGTVVADEPIAALAAHDVLARGGNAADAAAALGFALSVTLPSRASLGSGGACLAWKPGDRAGKAYLFLPAKGSDTSTTADADRPASVPMLARGLFLMHLHYGSVEFSNTLRPALQLASDGVSVGSLLAADLAEVQAPLLADKEARLIFGRPDGSVLQAGDLLRQRRLAGTIQRMRSAGPGDLYTGALARLLVDNAPASGSGLTSAALRTTVPSEAMPLTLRIDGRDISFLPPPADGGFGMAVAYRADISGHAAPDLARDAIAAWRSNPQQDAQKLLNSGTVPTSGTPLGNLPASTSFAVYDRKGGAVACALTMDNLFGTGRIAGSSGIVLGASPLRRPLPLLSAAIVHDGRSSFRAAVTASGQNQAADAAAIALVPAAAGKEPKISSATPDGRVNAIVCSDGKGSRCGGWTDPRGAGYAIPAN